MNLLAAINHRLTDVIPSHQQSAVLNTGRGGRWGGEGEGPAGTLPEFVAIAGDEGKALFCHYLNSSSIFTLAVI